MMPKLNNEKGITLVEILAVLVTTSFIGVIGYSILFSGLSSFEATKAETELRDEADIIMASLLNEMYVLRLNENENFIKNETSGDYYFNLKDRELGFINHHPVVKGKELILNSNIELTENTEIIKKSEEQYEVILELKHVHLERTLKTTSEIGIIPKQTNGGSIE